MGGHTTTPIPLPSPPTSFQHAAPVRLKLASGPKNPLRSLLLGALFFGMLIPLWFSRFDFPRSHCTDESITNLYGDLRSVVLYGCVVGILYIVKAIVSFLLGVTTTALVADENGCRKGVANCDHLSPGARWTC